VNLFYLQELLASLLALSAGEYVSVSSERNLEKSRPSSRKRELIDAPQGRLLELAAIYEHRGLTPATALE
jgi:VIT1/CCC1 family predicted Fe2+/Mn2+ transporter